MATFKVTLSTQDAAHEKAIEVELAKLCERDVDYNGATFEIARGDFTSVDDRNELRAATTMSAIRNALESAGA